jgi:tetratricopeptide (TPR) repeat protein/SAM-dependent methyltransferase
MNRKARRAAQRQEQKLGATQPMSVEPGGRQRLFDAAVHHHQNGRSAEAAQLYHRILADDPRHFKSLQNLGVIALHAGRSNMAADFLRTALAINEPSAEAHCNLAIALNEMGKPAEAVEHSRRAIEIKSNYVGAHMTLARALWMQGRRNDAVASYQCALLLKPDLAAAHAYLGNLLAELNRFDESRQCLDRAVELSPDNPQWHLWLGDLQIAQGNSAGSLEHYVRAMEINPENMVAHYSFGSALIAMGNFSAVVEYYEKFLELRPKFVHAYNLLARAYNSAGNPGKAVEAARRGLTVAETAQGKSIFVECLSNLDTFSLDLRELIIRAVSEPWSRPLNLAMHCITLIFTNEDIKACTTRAMFAWPSRLSADQFFGLSGLDAMANDKLLLAYLENSRLIGLPIEQLVTALRFALLEMAISTPAGAETDENILALCCAVARQCFVAEYALLHTSEEFARVIALQESVATALNAGSAVSAFHIAILAAYIPLYSLQDQDRLLAQPWPQTFENLLTQQVREPAEERALRNTIAAITPINDGISLAVRDQYEQHPYPRWVATHSTGVLGSINNHIRSQFPNAEFRNLPLEGPLQVLAAGCGTGQILVDNCRFAGAQTLAVDLSLTSLSYAKRKLQGMGLPNVELAQADILELGSLDRTFDVINAGGVLHHLRDPIAGLRVLLSLLRPDGFMNVALYSELARSDYVAAQRLIVERGYGSSSDEIRRFRSDLIASDESSMRNAVLSCPDFYSTSECRDLLFHVQEHRMTVPQLKKIFEAHDLRFIGFTVQPHIKFAYMRRFPDDVALNDLDNWHVFEQEHPRTFAGMYSFWVQKGRGAV